MEKSSVFGSVTKGNNESKPKGVLDSVDGVILIDTGITNKSLISNLTRKLLHEYPNLVLLGKDGDFGYQVIENERIDEASTIKTTQYSRVWGVLDHTKSKDFILINLVSDKMFGEFKNLGNYLYDFSGAEDDIKDSFNLVQVINLVVESVPRNDLDREDLRALVNISDQYGKFMRTTKSLAVSAEAVDVEESLFKLMDYIEHVDFNIANLQPGNIALLLDVEEVQSTTVVNYIRFKELT